ncbi:hypothetical protein BN938_1295 [Mucinivorans hirudinis]|uniref:Uncharacterized protein n=1 Tax=Mucinivorans hirudinis TaxID=1433126 RepID=A0A060RD07_9BACT|nr:hypothetical protein BN938_1295 [Mucinivorans hirudinis]
MSKIGGDEEDKGDTQKPISHNSHHNTKIANKYVVGNHKKLSAEVCCSVQIVQNQLTAAARRNNR